MNEKVKCSRKNAFFMVLPLKTCYHVVSASFWCVSVFMFKVYCVNYVCLLRCCFFVSFIQTPLNHMVKLLISLLIVHLGALFSGPLLKAGGDGSGW